MDKRILRLNKYATVMTDIKINRHPLKETVDFILCEVTRDIYADTESVPQQKVENKNVILIKDPNLDYINSSVGLLKDDPQDKPWTVVCTTIRLPRVLRKGDYISLHDILYKVSGVKPVNRNNNDILQCFIHPERDDFEVPLEDPIPVIDFGHDF